MSRRMHNEHHFRAHELESFSWVAHTVRTSSIILKFVFCHNRVKRTA